MTDEEFARLQAHLEAELHKKTLFNWLFWREERMERAYITKDPADLRLLRNRVIWSFAIVGVAWVALIWLVNVAPRLAFLATIVAGGFAFSGALLVMKWRAMAFRSGWLAGRRALYTSLREADERGLSRESFMFAEMDRDFNVHW